MSLRDLVQIAVAVLEILAAVYAIVAHQLIINHYRETGFFNRRQLTFNFGASASPLSLRSPFLFQREIAVIVGLGVFVNLVALAVSFQVPSILYLDMTGTAVAALLLGPWWGALVGLLSNSFVNWLLFTGSPTIDFFPWSLVNIAGGLYWGFMARRESFRKYLQSGDTDKTPITSHVYYLIKFGVIGVCLTSFVGTLVQHILDTKASFALNSRLAEAIDHLGGALQHRLEPSLVSIAGKDTGGKLAWMLAYWLQSWVRFLPDKSMSVIMAVGIIKYCFPVFKRELVLKESRPADNWIGPAIFSLVYVPSLLVFLTRPVYRAGNFWLLWWSPLIIGILGACVLWFRGVSFNMHEARAERDKIYVQIFENAGYRGMRQFSLGLWFVMALASMVFVLGIFGLIGKQFFYVATNFLAIGYGFLFLMYLIVVMAAQNMNVSIETKKDH